MIELNVLEALLAAGQALVFASLVYFLYLVIRHGDLAHPDGLAHDARPALSESRGSYLSVWLGEAEHAGAAIAFRVRDSA